MSYIKNKWATGDTITQDKLNNIETGIESAQYQLPIASTTTLGGVKVDGTSVTASSDGIISAHIDTNINSSNFTPIYDFTGKTLNVIGDSISVTTLDGQIHKFWHEWVKEYLNLGKVNNYGVSGTKISCTDETKDINAFCLRYDQMDMNADIIAVFGGVNDVWWDGVLGEYGDTDKGTVYGALDILCAGLKTMYPYSTIILITPTSECATSSDKLFKTQDVGEAMKLMGYKYSIPVLDAHMITGIYTDKPELAKNYTVDCLHLNDKGQQKLGAVVSSFLSSGCSSSAGIYKKWTTTTTVNCTSLKSSKSVVTFDNSTSPIQVFAMKTPANTTQKVYWSSDTTSVATVINEGIITPVGNGTATLTAICGAGKTTVSVTVKNFATNQITCTKVSLDKKTLTFTDKTPQTLTATLTPTDTTELVTWSSAGSMVTVKNGVVTPVSNGDTVITVTCGAYSDTCTVSVSGINDSQGGGNNDNLVLDGSKVHWNTGYYGNTGIIGQYRDSYYSDLVPCEPSTTYIAYNNNRQTLAFFDSDKNFAADGKHNNGDLSQILPTEITSPSNAAYLAMSVISTDTSDMSMFKVVKK